MKKSEIESALNEIITATSKRQRINRYKAGWQVAHIARSMMIKAGNDLINSVDTKRKS